MSKEPVLATRKGILYNADCLEILPTLGSASFDCIFADPPFNIGKHYGTKVNDKKNKEDYLQWTELWLEQCIRVLKSGGSLFVFNIPKWNISIAHYLSKFLDFRHWVTIDYKTSPPIPGKLYPSHYSLLYFTKGKPRKFTRPKIPFAVCRHCGKTLKDYGGYKHYIDTNGGINLSDVWTDISPIRHKKFKNWEYNELPEKILERVLEISTDPEDLVLDPFGGSGTTFAVAEKMARKWVGCELEDPRYIIKRLLSISQKIYKNDNNKFSTSFGDYESELGYSPSQWWSSRIT